MHRPGHKKEKRRNPFSRFLDKKKRNPNGLLGKFFKKKRKKTREEVKKTGTMGAPLIDGLTGLPINPDYPKKKKVKLKNMTTNKYDFWANKKYKKDFEDLNTQQKKSVRRRARMNKFLTPKRRGVR